MPKTIEVPGTGIVEFPDAMSDEEIVAAIQRHLTGASNNLIVASREASPDPVPSVAMGHFSIQNTAPRCWVVTDNRTGRKLELQGDPAPTKAELENIFGSQAKPAGTLQQQPDDNAGQEVVALILGAAVVCFLFVLWLRCLNRSKPESPEQEAPELAPSQPSPVDESEKIQEVIAFAERMLQVQFLLLDIKTLADLPTKLSFDHWVLGYVYGIHDNLAHGFRLSSETLPVAIAVSYSSLWDDAGTAGFVTRLSCEAQDDETFKEGRAAAWSDMQVFVSGGQGPMALWKRLNPLLWADPRP